jgi:hypothetical protein
MSFVDRNQDKLLLLLYLMGAKFGQKPSSWLLPEAARRTSSGHDLAFTLDLDVAAFLIGTEWERVQQEKARHEAGQHG